MFTVSQSPVWRNARSFPSDGELGEGRRLVVALLREALERLLGQDVDPAVDPVRDARDLVEAGDDVVVGQVDLRRTATEAARR